jgi:hypothetical protein
VPLITPSLAGIKPMSHNSELNRATMSYQTSAPKAVCGSCGSTELQPARDELAADPRERRDDLAECLVCGRFIRLGGY